MKSGQGLHYADVGVQANQEFGLDALLKWVRRTEDFRRGATGSSALDIGYFANVIDIGHGLGLAMTTDGVGTKVIVAAEVGRYDTIGIDCVAMNVNDLICVGAEPVSMLDYIGIEAANPSILAEIGQGLYEGARRANVNIVGGEISQIPEIIRGPKPGKGLDLIGMGVGTVPLDRVNIGQHVVPGDIILGLASSGIHSNGLTLARKVLAAGGYTWSQNVDELGRTVGEEILEPTRIYVQEVVDLLRQGLAIHALTHITSDGFNNLRRIKATVGFEIDNLPAPQPIFDLIQKSGNIPDAEMFRVYNMGVGFCLIVPDDRSTLQGVEATFQRHGVAFSRIGRVVEDSAKRVRLPQKNLVSDGDNFVSA